jgi:ribosome biogenesis SPOUT family RNA methylase Rps3
MGMKTKLIIEHLEGKLTRWLLLEYENASRWWNKEVWFTNVRGSMEELEKFGTVFPARFYEIIGREVKR